MTKETLAVLAVLALITLAAAAARKMPKKKGAYTARTAICTPAELAFLRALDQAALPSQRIFTMVRLIDVIEPAVKDHATRNRVIQKHLDFLLCDRDTTKPLCAIELNDRSHDQPKRRQRDDFVGQAMQQAGIPILFKKAARSYDTEELRGEIAQLLKANEPQNSTRP